jgi:glyoxylase-like metal-dependent hydrolase (beta-lactamase superfamily II)
VAEEPAIPLAPGVWRIPLIRDLVNGFILRDGDGQVTLVDMGVKQSGKKVMAALTHIGSGPSDVTRLMLTHAHPDHAGGAAYVAEQTGKQFGIHRDDAEFARTGQTPPRDQKYRLGRLMARTDRGFGAVPVCETFTDGQVVPFAGGLEVIHTPGHSPGHAAFLHRDSGVLITGDSIFNVLGLRWSIKALCTDFRMSQQTVVRLADLNYTTAAFTHGAHLSDRPREHIRKFLTDKGML